MNLVSLFSGGGLGDLGFHGAGFSTIAACEMNADRAMLLRRNFPEARVFEGDIHGLKDALCEYVLRLGIRVDVVSISPPCQGMSSNGMGRIGSQVRKGCRDEEDPRNRLILPALEILNRLRPRCVVIENVPRMRQTRIRMGDEMCLLLDVVRRECPAYTFEDRVINVADFGVPQYRKRLIVIGGAGFPEPTHTSWHVTLRDAIGHLPPLDGMGKLRDDDDELHNVPKWSEMQHFVMSHTPEGCSSFDNNTCVHCGHVEVDTGTVYCSNCQSLLPRPYTWCRRLETYRLVRAFKTAYRRMRWDRPCNAITQNSAVISSDVKGHPEQHRVLSVRELLILSSVQDARWSYDVDGVSDRVIREILGEGIPPLLMYHIATQMM